VREDGARVPSVSATETAMMGWYGGGMHGGVWLVMGLFWLLLIGAIVWLVVQLATSGRRGGWAGRPWGPIPRGHAQYGPGQGPWGPGQGSYPAGPWTHGPTGPAGESPFEVLDRRLATGEIDVDTYRQLRAALLESRGGQP